MKAYLINMHLLVPRSRPSAKVKVIYKGCISQKMAVSGAFMFHEHILFYFSNYLLFTLAFSRNATSALSALWLASMIFMIWKEIFTYQPVMIEDPNTHSIQPDLDLYCLQKVSDSRLDLYG